MSIQRISMPQGRQTRTRVQHNCKSELIRSRAIRRRLHLCEQVQGFFKESIMQISSHHRHPRHHVLHSQQQQPLESGPSARNPAALSIQVHHCAANVDVEIHASSLEHLAVHLKAQLQIFQTSAETNDGGKCDRVPRPDTFGCPPCHRQRLIEIAAFHEPRDD
ncbi:hypothetical protein AAC387_Pa07g0016 [Persea americana]